MDTYRVLIVDKDGNAKDLSSMFFDDTEKGKVSLYAKDNNPGDTPVGITSNEEIKIVSGIAQNFDDAMGNEGISIIDRDGNARKLLPSANFLFNGVNYQRQRNNEEITVLTSSPRTSTVESADIINYNGQAMIMFVDVSALSATPAIKPRLQIKDPVSGNYHQVWEASASITTVSTTVFYFGNGGSAGVFTEAINLRMPRTWRLQMFHGDADSITYSVAISNLV